MDVEGMYAVLIHPLIALLVLSTRYPNAEDFKTPLKKRPVSKSSSVDGQASKRMDRETDLNHEDVLDVIVPASTYISSGEALATYNTLYAAIDSICQMYAKS